MSKKHSQAELIRLLESGIREVGDLPKERFHVMVRAVKQSGSPPSRLVAAVVVHFLDDGKPFCCGEPACYSYVFRDAGLAELGDYVRRQMRLLQNVTVELKVDVQYFEGIEFTAHGGS